MSSSRDNVVSKMLHLSPFSVTLAAGAALVISYLLVRAMAPKPFPNIPHRAGSDKRLLGDLPDWISEISKTHDWNTWLLTQVRTLQAPLIQLFLVPFDKPVLFLSDYREAQDILLRRGNEFDRGRFSKDIFAGILPNFQIHMRTGPQWKAHRRLLQDLMIPSFLNNVAAPCIYDSTILLIDLWTWKARLAQQGSFEVGHDIHCAALDAVLSFSFGKAFPASAIEPQIQHLQSLSSAAKDALGKDAQTKSEVGFPQAQLDEAIAGINALGDAMEEIKASAIPRLKWKRIIRRPDLASALRAKNNLVDQQLQMAVEAMNTSNSAGQGDTWIQSAVHHMVYREGKLAEKEGRRPDYFSGTMRDELFGFVVGGHDTTSTTVQWGVKFIADHPDVQQTLRSHLLSSFPEAAADRRMPSRPEILHANIPYLDAVIEEMLRCALVVPAVDREAMCDTTLLGHAIPKGTVVFMSSAGPSFFSPAMPIEEGKRSKTSQASRVQTQDRVWDETNMAEFCPERWLVGRDIKSSAQDISSEGQVFDPTAGPTLPFGGGTRGCYGRRLAYIELRMLFISILWKFELLRVHPDHAGYDAYEGMVHKPKKCYVRLKLTKLGEEM